MDVQALSMDFRVQLAAAVDAGLSCRAAAIQTCNGRLIAFASMGIFAYFSELRCGIIVLCVRFVFLGSVAPVIVVCREHGRLRGREMPAA